jgi:hypothetical protein
LRAGAPLTQIRGLPGARTTYVTPALVVGDHRRRLLVDEPDGPLLAWGEQLDVRPVRMRADDKLTDERVAAELDHHGRARMLSGNAVAGYLAKYATKATEAVGHSSRRLTPSTVGLFANDTHPGRSSPPAGDSPNAACRPPRSLVEALTIDGLDHLFEGDVGG